MRARLAAALVVAALAGLLAPGSALAHAVLLESSPAANAQLAASPSEVTVRFNEEVKLLHPTDISVVDRTGNRVDTGDAANLPNDARAARVALRPGLADGTYTVRYLIDSADSHVVVGYFVFGVGAGELAAPYLGGDGQAGPSETSAWAVSARLLELLGLGGLVGLLAFRWLVWRPAWRGMPSLPGDDAVPVLLRERDGFWTAFSILAVGAMVAEAYLLLVKSASALGTSVTSVARQPGDVSTVLSATHFGALVQTRAVLLFALFALGAWQFLVESSERGAPTVERPSGRVVPAVVMAALAVAAIALVSVQGHASQAPFSRLQVAADVLHLGSVSIWITGLACVAVAMRRLPRAAAGGSVVAARVLARFSRVALAAVAVAIATGVARAAGELSDPAQLWDTSYGRSIIYKLLLLCPIGFVALRNRRVVTSLRAVAVPSGATLRMVRRSVGLEMTVAVAVVVVASILVAQVPGRV